MTKKAAKKKAPKEVEVWVLVEVVSNCDGKVTTYVGEIMDPDKLTEAKRRRMAKGWEMPWDYSTETAVGLVWIKAKVPVPDPPEVKTVAGKVSGVAAKAKRGKK